MHRRHDRQSLLAPQCVNEFEYLLLVPHIQGACRFVEQQDWRGFSGPAREERLEELLRADRQTSFELRAAPLMRVTLIRVGPGQYQFVWSIHHLLSDSQTVVVLLNDLFGIYQSLKAGLETN